MSSNPVVEPGLPVVEPAETAVVEPGLPVVEPVETFTSLPGAVGNPPEHYGNPLGEQKALAAGNAVVYHGHRGVITVTGPDRLTWLDSLTSQALAGLQPGESAETLQLDPTGRVEYAIRIVDDGSTCWLLVDASEAGPLKAWLDKMRFMLRVEIADRSADFVTIGSLGYPMEDAVVTWTDPWASVVSGGHQYAARDSYDWNYTESLFTTEPSYPAAGTLALEALRIAAAQELIVPPSAGAEANVPRLPRLGAVKR